MSRQEIFDVLLEMRLCRNGLVQTPEQLRFSLDAITTAMSAMDFAAPAINGCTTEEDPNDGIKKDPRGDDGDENENRFYSAKSSLKGSSSDEEEEDHGDEPSIETKENEGSPSAKRSKPTDNKD